MHNIVDPQRENKTPYFQRFGVEFNGPKIAFGALLMYKPANPDLPSKQSKFSNKLRHGIFAGYEQHAGGVWSNNLKTIDAEQLGDASSANMVHIQFIRPQEVTLRYRLPTSDEGHDVERIIIFPVKKYSNSLNINQGDRTSPLARSIFRMSETTKA